MEIGFKKISDTSQLNVIKELYCSAFPANERREYSGLVQLLYNAECVVNLIFADQKIAGFIIVWEFQNFVFIEHFAIEPELRGQGIGEKSLTIITKNYYKPVILETEPPIDEMSKRRVGFYQRNGFHLLRNQYFQPSYDGIKPKVELRLMSTKSDYSSSQMDECISVIREKVYHVF
jgi:ribosomal protein S18 acetylase RimI-like enzyme